MYLSVADAQGLETIVSLSFCLVSSCLWQEAIREAVGRKQKSFFSVQFEESLDRLLLFPHICNLPLLRCVLGTMLSLVFAGRDSSSFGYLWASSVSSVDLFSG